MKKKKEKKKEKGKSLTALGSETLPWYDMAPLTTCDLSPSHMILSSYCSMDFDESQLYVSLELINWFPLMCFCQIALYM